MSNPKYEVGEVLYIKESAALGFLEAIRISGIHSGQNGWMYTINAGMSPPSVGGYQDRRSMISTQTLYFTEDEFLPICDAVVLVEANAKAAYERAKLQRQQFCPDNPTES